jgi:hypothetical protein
MIHGPAPRGNGLAIVQPSPAQRAIERPALAERRLAASRSRRELEQLVGIAVRDLR